MQADLNFTTWDLHDSRITLFIESRDHELVGFKLEIKLPNFYFSSIAYFSLQMLSNFVREFDADLIDCDHKVAIRKSKHVYRDEYKIAVQTDSNSFVVRESSGNISIATASSSIPNVDKNADRLHIERWNVFADDMSHFLRSINRMVFTE